MKTKKVLMGWFLPVLALALTACDKTIGDADLQFAVHVVPFASESAARGSAAIDRVLETVEIPLENKQILSVSLVEDAAAPTRDADGDGIVEGALFRVVAYNNSNGAYVADAVYTYSGGALYWPSNDMNLTNGTVYDFVAYSYNDSSVTPPYSATVGNISPQSADLLWGTADDVVHGSGTVSLRMTHRFMRFKRGTPTVSEGANTPVFTTFQLLHNYSGNLQPATGVVDTVGTSRATLDLTNSYKIAYPAKAEDGMRSLAVNITGTINNISFPTQPVVFTKTLKYGGSYSLQINFIKGLEWAGSNIYWVSTGTNTGYLTFEPAGTPLNDDKQRYQGVYFKWGSLVGISSNTGACTLYEPTFVPGNPTASSWSVPTTPCAWTDIPYTLPEALPATRDDDMDYFATLSLEETKSLYSAQTGDICRYLGYTNPGTALEGYHTPTVAEIRYGRVGGQDFITYDQAVWQERPITAPVSNLWKPLSTNFPPYDIVINTTDGTYVMPAGAYHGTDALFPVAGSRWESRISGIYNGYYHSSSLDTDNNYPARFVLIENAGIYHAFTELFGTMSGHSVRCVKDH